MEVQTDEMSKSEKQFVLKAAYCDYNRIWKCQHPQQRGIKSVNILKMNNIDIYL